jgi:hypothetical protein
MQLNQEEAEALADAESRETPEEEQQRRIIHLEQ